MAKVNEHETDTDTWVPISQVAARAGLADEETVARALNGQVEVDWSGRRVIRAAVARAYVEGHDTDRARRAALREQHQTYLAEHGRLRWAYMQEIFSASYEGARAIAEKASRASGWSMDDRSHAIASRSPATRAAARDATAEMLAQYDRNHPTVELSEFERRGGQAPLPSPAEAKTLKRAEELGAAKMLEMMKARRL